MKTTQDKIYNDMYIFIPLNLSNSYKKIQYKEPGPLINNYIKSICDTSLYECNKRISKQLERRFLGKHKFLCMNDNYDEVIGTFDVEFILTSHLDTNLHILSVIFIGNSYSITQIEDQVSSKNLYIEDVDGSKMTISSYMENYYGLIQCGDEKCLICLNKKPEDEKELHCMLAAEAYNSVHVKYRVKSEEIRKAASNNLAEYDFYEIYASYSSLVYISDEISENFNSNLDIEAAIIFICEITLLQNAAISRTNARIVDELSEDVDISLKSIEKMYAEFGKTIIFWDKNIYNYSLAQNLADNISQAFNNDKLLSEYYRNQNYLEHIVELKGSISSAREGKILNILAFILSFSELFQLTKSVIDYIKTGNLMILLVGLTGSSLIVILLVFLAVWRKRLKHKSNKFKLV